jgi:hypothetical protein
MAIEATSSQFAVEMTWPNATAYETFYGTNLVIGASPLRGVYVVYAGAPCRTLPWLIATWEFFVAAEETSWSEIKALYR